MNSYNENLHSSIVSSLSDQELEMQKSEANRDASKFSLYYAQGDTITTAEKLEKDTEEYQHQQKTHKEAVIDSDFSTNVLSSANSSKSFVDESVSNTAVAAANVQIATNAIVKLASDIGSVYNIVNAGDYGTEIYDQSKYANKVMSETAYLAEKTSENSMNTSTSIAEVATTSLATKATTTDTSIKSLLEAVDANFKAKAEEVAIDSEALATSNTAEKAAEGVLEQNNVNYTAISDAYNMANSELNLNLKVLVPEPKLNNGEFVVSFNKYKSAFPEPKIEKSNNVVDGIEIGTSYPVEDYYIMLVKYDKSSIFSIANAEGIILEKEQNDEGKYRYIKVPPTVEIPFPIPFPMPLPPFTIAENHFKQVLHFDEMLDSDGKPMELGTDYVAFVFSTFSNDYKKLINTYDDYLSAPSKSFEMTQYLPAVNNNTIKVIGGNKNSSEVELKDLFKDRIEIDKSIEIDIDISDKEKISIKNGQLTLQNELDINANIEIDKSVNIDVDRVINIGKQVKKDIEKGKQIVVFATPKAPEDTTAKQYRCMFLLNDPIAIKNLLTADELKQIQKITDDKDRLVFIWTRKIQKIIDEIQDKQTKIQKASQDLDKIDLTVSSSDKKISKAITNKRDKVVESLNRYNKELEALQEKLSKLAEEQEALMEKLDTLPKVPEFYFDLTIAEKVPFGSYTIVENKIDVFDAFDIWYFQIESSTTDNFGNRLILDHDYIPTVLTISNNESYNENSKYTNALSNITREGIFTYKIFSGN